VGTLRRCCVSPGQPVIDPAGLDGGGGRVEGVNPGTVPGHEGRMLLRFMWVKAVDPEDRVIDAIADAIGPVLRKLHDPVQAKCAQSRIVKSRGPDDVRDTDARMVDQNDNPYSMIDLPVSSRGLIRLNPNSASKAGQRDATVNRAAEGAASVRHLGVHLGSSERR
jgi:hypothetical protein